MQGPTAPHPDLAFWRQRVQEWYPRWRDKTYFIPPVYMNRTQHQEVTLTGPGSDVVTLAGQTVLVTQPPVSDLPRGAAPALLESDVREDQSQRMVLDILHELSEAQREVMFVISQLHFGDYLNNPAYSAAAATLPRPIDLKLQNKHRGDFDVLVIHRHYGILVGEIKAIGDGWPSSLPQQQRDQQVKKKVELAIGQLQKADEVLRHLVSDLQTAPRVQTTLMLPSISTAQLQRVLADNPQLSQDLCQCLGVAGSADPILLCLTSDDVSKPGQWWQQRVRGAGTDPAMTDHVYLHLVSRFGGPATTVRLFCSTTPRLARQHSLRTKGEAVSETGWRFTQLVLHPAQVDVLNAPLPFVYLTGPPGTGKTLVLIVKALGLLRRHERVHVVSTWRESLAASYSILYHLQKTAAAAAVDRHLIHFHVFNFSDGGDVKVQIAVRTLLASESWGQGGGVNVIADEVYQGGRFADFCNRLHLRASRLTIWAASVLRDRIPTLMQEVILTEPLRTPPSVTAEVQRSDRLRKGRVHSYTDPRSPLPSVGPAPLYLYHTDEHGALGPIECRQCGLELAKLLKEELQVGVCTDTARPAQSSQPLLPAGPAPRSQTPLPAGPAPRSQTPLPAGPAPRSQTPLLARPAPSSQPPLPARPAPCSQTTVSAGPSKSPLPAGPALRSQTPLTARPAPCSQTPLPARPAPSSQTTVAAGPAPSCQPPLQFRDVFVLTSSISNIVHNSDELVQGLQQGGIPVTVLRSGDAGAVAAVAKMAGADRVVATSDCLVRGLERKVVVWVQAYQSHDGDQWGDERVGRLQAVSRCTSQLVFVLFGGDSG